MIASSEDTNKDTSTSSEKDYNTDRTSLRKRKLPETAVNVPRKRGRPRTLTGSKEETQELNAKKAASMRRLREQRKLLPLSEQEAIKAKEKQWEHHYRERHRQELAYKSDKRRVEAYISEHGLAAFLNNYSRKDYRLKYKGDLCAGSGNGNRSSRYYPSLPSESDFMSTSLSSNNLQIFAASPSPDSNCIPQKKAYPVRIIARSSNTVGITGSVSSTAIEAAVTQDDGDGYIADREEQTVQCPDVDSTSDIEIIVNPGTTPSSL